MAPPPYERLYADIEEGVHDAEDSEELEDDYGAHDLHSTFKDLSPSPRSSFQFIISRSPSFKKSLFAVPSLTRRAVIFCCVLFTSAAFVTLWARNADGLEAKLVSPPDVFPHPTITTIPSDDADSGAGLRYASVSYVPSHNTPHLKPTLPSLVPIDVLPTLLDPPSLLRENKFRSSWIQKFLTPPKFDMVWTWVNGSDPLHRDAFVAAERDYAAGNLSEANAASCPATPSELATSEELSAALRRRQITAPRLYREHDELRYSTRSVLQYFGEHVRQFHLVAGDFVDRRNTCDSDVDVVTRLGQIPQWLRDDDSDPEELSSNANVPLRIHHHAQFFDHYRRTTFDSCAIEAQMARLEGVDEHFVYMNDDLFFYDHLQPMDFYHPAYGIVLRVQSDLLVGGSNPSYQDGQGEWRPLEFSNWLLDQRYGTRRRSYVQHGPKSMSMSILRELTVFEKFEHAPNDTLSGTFREALLTTGQHTFRGQYTNHLGHDDAYAAFLLTHHIMERWREILLWSWAVGRVGGRSNEWTDAERTTAWIEVGGKVEVDSDADSGKRVEVGSGQRDTLDYDTVNAVLGGEGATTYSFSSLDGYPYAYTQGGPITHWPQFTPTSSWIHGRPPNAPRRITPVCHIEREKCFPSHMSTAADAFTHIAFDETACGDCIIRALVNASGKSGLKAFLPDASRTMEYEAPSSQADDYDPMLPLESSWKEVDFSARAVLEPWAKAFDSGLPMSEVRGRVNVREWVMRAMVRYRFVFGDTPFQFLMLRSPSTLSSKLDHLAADKPRPAMFCLNDNLAGSNYEMARVPEIFQRWMTDAWPEKAWWEQ